MLLRPLFLALFSLSIICTPAQAEDLTRDKRADIELLLEKTDALSIGRAIADYTMSSFMHTIKKLRPDIPQNFLNILRTEMMETVNEDINPLKEEIISLYHRHFTASEIKEMVRFYSTDLGQKTIKVMPILMQEGVIIGQRWGQSFQPRLKERVNARLKQQGFDI